MFNTKQNLYQLLLTIYLSACSKSSNTIQNKTSTPTVATPIAAEPAYVPKGNIYETSYTTCVAECDRPQAIFSPRRVITWDKPSAIGIVYPQGFIPDDLPIKLIPKFPDTQLFGINHAYIVIKSKGVVSGIKAPLSTERFTPIAGIPMPFSIERKADKPVLTHGIVRIESIKLLNKSREEAAFNYVISLEDSLTPTGRTTVEAGIPRYYSYYKDNSDIQPQQVDRITWQEGQSPQVIPVRKW